MTSFIGREREIARLKRVEAETQSQLVVVYGRRRVGKTFLITNYFRGRFDFKFTGAYQSPRESQLQNFTIELNDQTGTKHDVPKDWTDAFNMLKAYIRSLPAEDKKIIFFDEMPWMDTQRSGFLSAFEWFWNDWGSMQENLIFIVCGSATSWMTEHISSNKGGLFNRANCQIYLEPFTLKETEEFLKSRNINWARFDIAECYMIMGGIPYYLNLLDPELSYADNIDNLFFRKRAELWNEFSHLYHTLFSNGDAYIRVVMALSNRKSGMTRDEISAISGMPGNGTLTKMLNDLADSGFIRIESFYGNRKKSAIYQLSDYYTLFYFRFIQDNYGRDEHYWRNTFDDPSRRVWAGLTFELLCKDHIDQIKKKLGISGISSEQSSWFSRPSNDDNSSESGAQIDLLIDRRDRVVTICEMKFSQKEFTIDKQYDAALRNKLDVFREQTGCSKTLQLIMVTSRGLKQNKYSSIISAQVVLDDLFEQAE